MKNYFFLLLLIVSNLIYSQKKVEIDSISMDYLDNRFDTIFKNKSRNIIDNEKLFPFIKLLEQKIKLSCINNIEECEYVKEILAQTIINKMMYVHKVKNENDSLQFYNNYLKNKSASNYYLGKASVQAALGMLTNNNITAFLKLSYEAIDLLESSDKKYTNHNKFNVYKILIDVYCEYDYSDFALQTLKSFEIELNTLKNHEFYPFYLKIYEQSQGLYYAAEKDYEKSIALLESSLKKTTTNSFTKFKLYIDLIFATFKNKNYDETKRYLNLAFTKEYEALGIPIYKDLKNNAEINLYWELKDYKKYEKAVQELIASPNTKQGNYSTQRSLAQYYSYKKDYKNAYTLLKSNTEKRDSLERVKSKITKEITAFKIRKDAELKSLGLKNQQKETIISKDKEILIATILILLLLGSLIIAIVYFIKNKRNQATQLKLEKSEEINIAKNTFLENISHEVRTPITIINGYLSLLKESILEPKKVLEYSNLISKNTDGLLNSLNNFLTVFKSQNTNNVKQHKEFKNLDAFCENAVLDFKGVCEIKNIALYYKTNIKDKLDIEYDYFNLQKIIYNLISNAIKYSNSNTAIYIALSIQENNFQLTVKDEGFGISEKDQKHIFERFYQSDKNLRTGGFGIGLSYVHQLVASLNGNIDLKSELNVGSIFTINLPIALENSDLYTKENKAIYNLFTDKAEEKALNNDFPKALIVDDNIALTAYYKTIFSSFLQCTFAFNGKEALENLKKTSFDIILSDLRMPILDGATLKQEINKDKDLKQTPFVMITAVSYDFMTDKDMTVGINDYIVKPFEKDEIVTRVKALLEHKMHTKQLLADEDSEKITFDSSYSELLEKINTKIRENLNNNEIDIKTLASELGYTQRNLNRILQKVTGLTLVKIVLEIRLQKAYEYVVNNSYNSLSEIMFETGFNSRPYFYKKFKDRFGIKPGNLKKKYS